MGLATKANPMYPREYKSLLTVLRNGPKRTIPDLVSMFPAIRAEIEANRNRADVIDENDPDGLRMEYSRAREIVTYTVDHQGFIEIDGEMYDSIDDCADILMDLDETEQLEGLKCEADVWWQYIFGYDSHYGEHMKNLELQSGWLTRRSTGRANARQLP